MAGRMLHSVETAARRISLTLADRLRRARCEGGVLRRNGNFFSAYLYAAFLILGVKKPVRVSFNGQKLWVRPCTPDVRVACETFSGEFDEAVRSATPLRYNFIIDAGGYIGTAAVLFARAFPHATIVTLEPSEENFPLLVTNTRTYSNVVPLKYALGTCEKTAQLYDRQTGEWGYTVLSLPRRDGTQAVPIHAVQTVSIPALLRRFQVDGIDLLKLDIEGAEQELFADKPGWVGQTRVIFAEIHERVIAGSEDAFRKATAGRAVIPCRGEKALSALEYS